MLTLRLLGHLHHQLFTCKKAPVLLNKAVQKVHNFSHVTMEHTTQQMQSVTNLLTKIIKEVPSDIEKLFPTKALGEMLDSACAQSPNQATTQSYKHQLSDNVGPLFGGPLASSLGSSNGSAPNQTLSNIGIPPDNLQQSVLQSGCQSPPFHQTSPQVVPPADICMKSATAWLLPAKAIFCAAQSLFTLLTTDTPPNVSETSVAVKCDFPAQVCFLCHDAVEKSIKGVLYAFCGLTHDLVNCNNLVKLHDFLDTSSHCPRALVISIKECVRTLNRNENRSQHPNCQNPPCAPDSTYDLKDAQEAFEATKKLLHDLQSEENLRNILGDLGQMPTVIPTPVSQSLSNNPGNIAVCLNSGACPSFYNIITMLVATVWHNVATDTTLTFLPFWVDAVS